MKKKKKKKNEIFDSMLEAKIMYSDSDCFYMYI